MNNISIVEVIAKTLKLIDKHGTDYRITKTEFDLVKEDKHAMKILLGKSLNTISWDNFKFHFIESEYSLSRGESKVRNFARSADCSRSNPGKTACHVSCIAAKLRPVTQSLCRFEATPSREFRVAA